MPSCELCHNIYLLQVLFVAKELPCKTLTSSLRIDGKTHTHTHKRLTYCENIWLD